MIFSHDSLKISKISLIKKLKMYSNMICMRQPSTNFYDLANIIFCQNIKRAEKEGRTGQSEVACLCNSDLLIYFALWYIENWKRRAGRTLRDESRWSLLLFPRQGISWETKTRGSWWCMCVYLVEHFLLILSIFRSF